MEAVTYTADGESILIAGDFTTVNGKPAERIARLHLDGILDTSFHASAARRVKDFALVGDRLIVGGEFGKINGKEVRGLAAIKPGTGALDHTFKLPIAESRDRFAPYVQELDVSADGKWLVIGGNFQRVGTASAPGRGDRPDRHQPARSRRGRPSRYASDCAKSYDDTYIRGIDISPDSSFFVVNTTGAYIGYNLMCDSTVAVGDAADGKRQRPAADLGRPHRRRHVLGGRGHRVGGLRRAATCGG